MNDWLPRLMTPAMLGLLLAAVVLVLFGDWRVRLGALAVQYAGAALLSTQLVVFDLVLVKLISGLIVVAILTLTGVQTNFGRPRRASQVPEPAPGPHRFELPTGFPFRLMATLMVVVGAAYASSQTDLVLPGLEGAPAANAASYLLLALGLLNLGLTEEPLHTGMSLLTLIMGFELFYVAVEQSFAVVALLAAVQFGIALAVSYLTQLQHAAGEEAATS